MSLGQGIADLGAVEPVFLIGVRLIISLITLPCRQVIFLRTQDVDDVALDLGGTVLGNNSCVDRTITFFGQRSRRRFRDFDATHSTPINAARVIFVVRQSMRQNLIPNVEVEEFADAVADENCLTFLSDAKTIMLLRDRLDQDVQLLSFFDWCCHYISFSV